MPAAAAGDQSHLALDGDSLANHVLGLQVDLDEIGMRHQHALESLADDVFHLVDQLLHVSSSLSRAGRGAPGAPPRPPGRPATSPPSRGSPRPPSSTPPLPPAPCSPDGLLPLGPSLGARRVAPAGLPGRVHLPVLSQFVQASPEA